MDHTTYENLAKAWDYVEEHATARQSNELKELRIAAQEAGMPQSAAMQAALLAVLVRLTNARSVIAVGTGSLVETLELVRGLDGEGQLTAVDSSAEGIALIRKSFDRIQDETDTTLRAVNATAGTFLPRLNANVYDLIVVAGDASRHPACFVLVAQSYSRICLLWSMMMPTAAWSIPPTVPPRPQPCGNCWRPWNRTRASTRL